jgi:DNA polymerase II small subunit
MKSIIELFSKHGTLLQQDAVEYILSKDKPEEFAMNLIKSFSEYPLVLTIDDIKKIEKTFEENKEEPINIELKSIEELREEISPPQNEFSIVKDSISNELEKFNQELNKDVDTSLSYKGVGIGAIKSWKPSAKEYDPEIKILKDVTGNSTCEGEIKDFALLFQNRYKTLRNILRKQRREVTNTISIDRIKKNNIKEVQLIGIVKDVRTTANGHRLIEIEDETGSTILLVPRDNYQLLQLANEIVFDEVIGVRGVVSRNGDIIILQNIVFPDVSIKHEKNKADTPLCVAFPADIHIGSKMFLEKEWDRFIKWLNGEIGNSRQREVAGKIKYLVIPGDTVDGIGVYPDQEKELAIKDVYEQYEELARQLQRIPDYISIIIQPGNHDAVRPAEPQPAFEKEVRDLFSGVDITFVGNPCYLSLHGVEILSYHGQSLLDFATNIQNLKYNEPVEIMKIILKKRHLSPTYGGHTPIAPEHIDYMIIDRIPDVFVTGHVHMSKTGEYRGITLINASSWQAQTSYQKMLNFVPDPGKLPIFNLKTGKATTMDFTLKT